MVCNLILFRPHACICLNLKFISIDMKTAAPTEFHNKVSKTFNDKTEFQLQQISNGSRLCTNAFDEKTKHTEHIVQV